MREQTFLRPLTFMSGGLLIWAVHFAVLYAINALACARGFAGREVFGIGVVTFGIGAATLVAVAALGWIVARTRTSGMPYLPRSAGHQTGRFMNYMAVAIAGLSLVGVIWDAIPVLIIPPCG